MADVGSLNIVILIGRVAGEVRFERGKGKDSNVTIANFTLATNEVYGDEKPRAQFHPMVAFGKRAETCHRWCKKGQLVAIKGRLRHNRWTDQQGNKRRSSQVNIDEITFLGKKEDYAEGPKDEETVSSSPEKKEKKDPF